MGTEQRFELMSTLGRGGMAEVFLGWMFSVGGLRRKVAIKRILPELAQKQSKLFQQMFVDEARLAFQLEHDNIVRVYDVGQSANSFFIVMEYIEGMDLKSVIERMKARNTPFPIGIALYIVQQVSAGLSYAHNLQDHEGNAMGLIHNDISPPNILIGRYGEVKIADFGLSDALSNDVSTPEGMIKGKFAYISPEGTKSPPNITSQSDIFSLGIVLWEMLAGRRLFQRESDLETFKAVQAATIPDLRRIRSDIPEALIQIVHKTLAANPADRYSSADQLFLEISSLATVMGIPLNRFDLSWLINDLADKKWTLFKGEKVSKDVQMSLEQELGNMLPPGDAELLKTFVTGMSVVEEDKSTELQGGPIDWVADVFEDLDIDNDPGFDMLKIKSDSKPKIDNKHNIKRPSSKSPTPVVHLSSKAAQAKDAESALREVSGLLPSSLHEQKFAAVKKQRYSNIYREFKHQQLAKFFGGLVLGLLLGVAIGIVVAVFS
ncbi:MAG: serine/threonine-protein kinase [Bradymonadales bacterium]|jgi:serine/threonine protein kinase